MNTAVLALAAVQEAPILDVQARRLRAIKVARHWIARRIPAPPVGGIQQQLRITPDEPGLSDAYQMLVLLAGEMMSLDTRVHNLEAAQQGH